MTAKDTPYKLRQVEFRHLNKRSVKAKDMPTGKFPIEDIVHKEKYTGQKGK